jgi:dipeptidyl aminopeptidase/acylaminoacyl peptidase
VSAKTEARTNRRHLTPDDLLKIVTIDDAQIAPDGSSVAYVVKRSILDENRYASAIHLISTSGNGQPRKLTAGDRRDGSPRWSPDGQHLAFISDRSGVGQIYLLDLRGGEARQVSQIARGVSSPVWSPDGTRIAVLSSEGEGMDDETRKRAGGFIRHIKRLNYRFNELDYIDDRFNHVWVVDVATGEATRVTQGETSIQSMSWSPDGRSIAYTTNRRDETSDSFHSQLYVAAVDGSCETMASEGSEDAVGPAWSPDGSRIAFIGRRPETRAGGNNDIFLATPDGGALVCLTDGFDRSPGTGTFSDTWGPRDHTPLSWAADGSSVYFTASDHGCVGVYKAAADGSGVTQVVGGERTIGYVSFSADGQRMAFAASGFTNPCDIYTCDADGSDERRLTHLNADVLSGGVVQEPERMPFESFDGQFQIDAWLIRPVGYEAGTQYPLVQIIHGGPHSIFGATFFFDMQLWANQGWNVLFMNPRASQGYGEAFAVANIGDWGGADWKEQEQALDLAIERGGVDPDRLAVTGLSYGGFMTNWIVGQTDRYKVAVSENGICNLVSFFTTSDIGWYWLEPEMERKVWENLDWYMQASPISYIQNMNTPMLLLQAESDFRCPIEQGEQLYTALRARGVPAEMVRFPGENHVQLSNGKPETRLVRREVTLDWMRRYLA